MPRWMMVGVCALICAWLGACSADETGGSERGGGSGASDPNNPFGNSGGGSSTTDPGGFGNPSSGIAGSGATPGGGDSFEGCATADVRASRVKPTVLFVIDGSGSMDMGLSGGGGGSRWDALRSALMDPGGLVPTLEAAVEFGMVMYDGAIDPLGAVGAGLDAIIPGLGAVIPSAGSAECPRLVIVDPALNNFATLDSNYPAQPLGGSTPTHIALDFVMNNVADAQQVQLDQDLGPQYVVLATDGAPNDFCEGGIGADASPQVIQAANLGAQKGVKMFVISLAGDDPNLRAHLEQVAQIGGTGSPPFEPATKDELTNVLTQIIGGAVGCDVALNGAVEMGQECAGVVNVNGVNLPCNDPNGWHLKDERTIELVGTACDDFKGNPESMLHADFPCGVFAPD